MIRIINILLAVTATLSLVAVYGQKSLAEGSADQIGQLNAAIEDKQEQLSILRADWAFLNQPTHIQTLVNRHNDVLGLQIAAARQFSTFDALPMRPEMRLDTDALNELFAAIEEGDDPIGSLLEDLL